MNKNNTISFMAKNLNLKISLLITILMFLSASTVYFIKNKHYSIDVFLNKANICFLNENFLQASKYYKKLISMGIDDEKTYINTSISLIKLGDYQKAIKYLNEILQNKSSSEVYYLLGYTYYSRSQMFPSEKDMDEAVKYLKESIELDDKNIKAYYLLGQIYEQLKQFNSARLLYRKALFGNIEDPSELYRFIAYTYFEENKFDDAVKSYNKAIECNNNNISAYCDMGELYKIKNDFAKAEQYYKKAIRINPDYILPYYKIGNMYDKENNYKKAIEWYNKALAIDSHNDIVNYYIGMSYKNMNMLPESIKYLKLSAYCGNDDAVNELRTMVSTF